MSFTLTKPDGSGAVIVDDDSLSIPGYVEYLLENGYVVPEQYHPAGMRIAGSVDGDDSTEKPLVSDRAVEYTPAGQPIYGSVATAKTAMDAMFAEKMATAKREQPALFPEDPAVRDPGPAEKARANKWVPPHRREAYAENSWSANRVRKGQTVVTKKLNLSAVLRDRSVQETYGLRDDQLNLVRVLMQTSPEKAAIKATECVRDNGHKVIVIPDLSAASRAIARASLNRAADEVSPHVRCREVPMVYLPGSTLVSLVPRSEDLESEERFTWELTGPGREFVSVASVWMLIMEHGPFAVADRFGADYGFLRIMITVIDRQDRKATTLVPGYEMHSGNRFDAWSSMSRDLMNTLEDLKDIDFGCSAVVTTKENAVASAAIVDENWAVVPYHVLKTPGGRIGAEIMEKADVKRLGPSLHAVLLKTPRKQTVGLVRAPVDGEEVAMRVVGFDGLSPTRTLVTVAGKVTRADEYFYVQGVSAVSGTSGATYYSLRDGRPVGLHDGTGALGARMLPFRDDSVSLLNTTVCWYGGGGPTRTRVLSPTVRYWSRGKATRAAWSSFSARLGFECGVMTVLDGNLKRIALPIDAMGDQSPWERVRSSSSPLARVYRGARVVDAAADPLPLRGGLDGENVVLVCFDDEGVYMSSETTFGEESQIGRGNVHWASMLKSGALVVAVKDVTVIGVLAKVAHTSEWVTFRVPSSTTVVVEGDSQSSGTVFGPSIEENRMWLKEKFPFLNVGSYSSALIDECFTHSSCGSYQEASTVFSGYQNMARIGDAIMKARYHVLLRLQGVEPQSTSLLVGKWQNNEVQAVVASQFGLEKQLRRASRLTTIGQHGLADALEAVACLVYFNEDAVCVDRFLRVIAMFGEN